MQMYIIIQVLIRLLLVIPDDIFYEWADITNYYWESEEVALSYILDKYNAGISLLKYDRTIKGFKGNEISKIEKNEDFYFKEKECD